jgi:hypothetical protein
LFDVNKIGVFVDSYSPGVEKRRGESVSVITLNLRIQPFDAKLATALDSGVGGDSNIKATIFSLNSGDPKKNFTRHDFKLALERQNLEIFPTPDTNKSRISLNQVRISGTYVRTQKDNAALALVFKATFGPVGRDELELIHSLHRMQTFVTFHQGEPILEDAEEVDDADGENAGAQELGTEGQTARETGSRRKLHTNRSARKPRTNGSGEAHA